MATGNTFYPTAQAPENERCPVQLHKAFAAHGPLEMKQPDSPFFLAINHRRQPSSEIWYSKAALGKNEIGKFLSKAAKAAKLPGNITNHSVRKTCISCLMDADILENFVAHATERSQEFKKPRLIQISFDSTSAKNVISFKSFYLTVLCRGFETFAAFGDQSN